MSNLKDQNPDDNHKQRKHQTATKAIAGRELDYLSLYFPQGQIRGEYFEMGNIKGEPGESLKLHIPNGPWEDSATGEQGDDAISLVAAHLKTSPIDAAQRTELFLQFNQNSKQKSQLSDTLKTEEEPSGEKTSIAEPETRNLQTKDDLQENGKRAITTISEPLSLEEKFQRSIVSRKDKIAEMKARAHDAVFVTPFSLSGQATVIYMEPNGGKTLIAFWSIFQSIKASRIRGEDVNYILADDTGDGGIEKAELAEETGFHVSIPDQEDGSIPLSEIPFFLDDLVKRGQATGKVFIMDTLKKLGSLMNKDKAAWLCSIIRRFVQAGGTFIALAHTNKYKDEEGKPIYEGVGDFRNDFDCVYIGTIDTPEDQTERQVTFHNQKRRGPVPSKVSFQYDAGTYKTWPDRFHSVKQISESEAQSKAERLFERRAFSKVEHVIRWIYQQIQEKPGILTSEIKKLANCNDLTEGQNKTADLVKRYSTQHPLKEFQFWKSQVGDKNAQHWFLTDHEPPFTCE